MVSAMKGAASSITSGTATAIANTYSCCSLGRLRRGDASSTTGKSVKAGIVHNGTISAPAANATSIGSQSGVQKATTTRRRSLPLGQSVSLMADKLGRVASTASETGAAM